MTPRTTAVGAKEQNGVVEAANGAIERRLEQVLLLRGNRDFDSVEAWQTLIDEVVRKANAGRAPRVGEDLAAIAVSAMIATPVDLIPYEVLIAAVAA